MSCCLEAECGRKISTGTEISQGVFGPWIYIYLKILRHLQRDQKRLQNIPEAMLLWKKILSLSTFKLQIDENHTIKDAFNCYLIIYVQNKEHL